ncbi:MAG TPA: preprotein translocase subunit YajC [Gaiellaceae bacterium]|nr:preprotein translocase subunit YajC [Gaiellaceae bacterium]
MTALIFLGGMLILFYLLIVMPQRRRRQVQAQLLQDVEVGDEVMTLGGIFGFVREVEDHHIVLEIAPDTRVRLAKSAITARTDAEAEEEAADSPGGSTDPAETPLP